VIVYLDLLSGVEVAGWAYDQDDPLRPVTLSLHIDDGFVQDLPCDGIRPDVLSTGFPTARVGFSAAIPARYCDDQPHLLELRSPDGARVIDPAVQGKASREFRFPATIVSGLVEGVFDGAFRGWAFRHDRISDRKHGGVQILVTGDGRPLGQVVANQLRADVAKAHGCDPMCGFQFVAPSGGLVGRPVELRFNAIPGGAELRNSPYLADLPEPESHRKLRHLQASADQMLVQISALRAQIADLLPRERFSLQTYDRWAQAHQTSLTAALVSPVAAARNGREPPLISLISTAWPSHPTARISDVVAAVQSVIAQSYAKWELIIVGDGSTGLGDCIADLAGCDSRIRPLSTEPAGGIGAAVDAALNSAKGRYIGLLGLDTRLARPALAFMVEAALRTGARALYCDEDCIDDNGMFSDARLKPDWNYRLLLAQNYIGQMLLVERSLLKKAGPLRSGDDGAAYHDLLLRLAEITPADGVHHVPEILCHTRKPQPAVAETASGSPAVAVTLRDAATAGVRAVSDHLARQGLRAEVAAPRGDGCYDIEWSPEREPTVSIIIPYRDHIGMTQACVEAIRRSTGYRAYEIVLMDNGSISDAARAFAAAMNGQARTRIVRVDESFNFARLNNLGAAATQGTFLLFMNNDVFVSDPRWLARLVGEAMADKRVAIVGNKLLYPNGRVQHAGLVLGVAGIAEHAHRGLPADHPGYMARAICAQDVSAVTAACMLCRRKAFVQVGGFDETSLPVSLNDVDLCLKVAAAGYRIVWTPASVAEHRESQTRGSDFEPDHQRRFLAETAVMQTRWGEALRNDRFYHRHFSRTGGLFADLGDPEGSEAASPEHPSGSSLATD
jgi:GT2 family glycosyltransferase